MVVGIRLQDLSRVYRALVDVFVDFSSRQQAFLRIRHRLFSNRFLPWTLEDQVDDVAKEQSEQSDLRCHAEDTDHETDIKTQCWNKTDKRCHYQDRQLVSVVLLIPLVVETGVDEVREDGSNEEPGRVQE